MFLSLRRALLYAVKDFGRNIWLSFITITIVTLALISVNVLFSLNFFSRQAVKAVQEKIDISVYFKPKATEIQVLELKSTLEALPAVKSVRHITADQALVDFKEKNKGNPEILSSLDEVGKNPLGASLSVKAYTPQDFSGIMEMINRPRYEEVIQEKNFDEHKDVITKIDVISARLGTAGIILTLIFTLIAIIVVSNTVRVIIYTHKDEIKVMKLVGATNGFIRLPYVISGLIFSFLGMALLLGVWYVILSLAEPYLMSFFEFSDVSLYQYFNQNFIYLFGGQLLAVCLLNVVSSWLAVSRHLKV